MTSEPSKKRLFQFSAWQLLASLVLLLLAYPFLEDNRAWGDYVATILFSFVLITSLLVAGEKRGTLIIGIALILPALVIHWISHFSPITKKDTISLITMSLAIAYTIWNLAHYILRANRVDANVLCAGISVYLLIGLMWGHFYMLVESFYPGSFSFPPDSPDPHLDLFKAIYFSFSTLTTAGYGDISPLLRHARSLASIEAICGVLFLAIFISRLASLYNRTPVPTAKDSPPHH